MWLKHYIIVNYAVAFKLLQPTDFDGLIKFEVVTKAIKNSVPNSKFIPVLDKLVS